MVYFQWKIELDELIDMAINDGDQWVSMIGEILRTYPSTLNLNCDVEDNNPTFHEVLNDLKKTGDLIFHAIPRKAVRLTLHVQEQSQKWYLKEQTSSWCFYLQNVNHNWFGKLLQGFCKFMEWRRNHDSQNIVGRFWETFWPNVS
jgi:hypothetical protein